MTREQLERDALALVTGNYWATWRHLRLVLGVHIIGANSLLATLPREVIQQIARLVVAQRPRNCPHFEPLTDAQVVQQGSMWNVSTDEMRRALLHVLRPVDGYLCTSLERLSMRLLVGLDLLLALLAVAFPILSRRRCS